MFEEEDSEEDASDSEEEEEDSEAEPEVGSSKKVRYQDILSNFRFPFLFS